jgi:hypothetical protein
MGAVCAVQCSLLLPTTFYIALSVRQKRMSLLQLLGLGGMLLVGIVLMVIIIVEAFRLQNGRGQSAVPPLQAVEAESCYMQGWRVLTLAC